MDQAQIVGIVVGLGALAVLLLVVFFKANIVLCQPNELLVVAGRKRKLADGSTVGYRLIRGGRGFKMPLVESVARLSLTTLTAEIHIAKAMCKGMIPVSIEGRAAIKLAGQTETGVENAVERFLGKGPDAVMKTAQQAIEGALRGVISGLAAEEANRDRLDLTTQATARAREDLQGLGIVLDFLQILEISDEQRYLDAIGRQKNAEVQRDARIAEATSDSDARRVSAEQKHLGREAEIAAELKIVEAENSLAVRTAQLQAEANRAQERAKIAGEIARAEKEIELQAKRADLNENRERADTIIPARAQKEALMLRSEGKASRIVEDGKATAQAIELMRQQWQDGETRDLFLIQLMPELLDKVTRVVAENLRIDRLTILDGGDGNGMPTYVQNLTKSAIAMLEQLKNATGLDLAQLGRNKGQADTDKVPKELP
jgi:flotillin